MISTRRLCGLVLAALLTATLLSLPSGATAAPSTSAVVGTSVAVDPKNDYARMPRGCVGPGELIPQKPVECHLNEFRRHRPTIVLWGDSHAWQMIPALRKAARDRAVNLVAFVMGSCPVMDNDLTAQERETAPACLRSNDLALRYVARLKARHKKVLVLLGTYWQRYLQAIEAGNTTSYHGQMAARFKTAGPALFRTLGRMRVPVHVDGQIVTVPKSRRNCPAGNQPYACDLPRSKALRDERDTTRWVKHRMRALSGTPRYVNVNQMCTATKCYAKSPNGIFTFWDDMHISASAARYLSYVLDPTVTKAGGKKLESDGDGDGGGCIPLLTC